MMQKKEKFSETILKEERIENQEMFWSFYLKMSLKMIVWALSKIKSWSLSQNNMQETFKILPLLTGVRWRLFPQKILKIMIKLSGKKKNFQIFSKSISSLILSFWRLCQKKWKFHGQVKAWKRKCQLSESRWTSMGELMILLFKKAAISIWLLAIPGILSLTKTFLEMKRILKFYWKKKN